MGKHFKRPSTKKAFLEPTGPAQMVGKVLKKPGGCNVEVMCSDKKKRVCVMRGKLRGKGKRDNFVAVGSIVLLSTDETGGCDLVCVYSDTEVRILKNRWPELVNALPQEELHDSLFADYEEAAPLAGALPEAPTEAINLDDI